MIRFVSLCITLFTILGFAADENTSVVTVKGKSESETVAKNTPLDVFAPINSGENFVGWKIESGTGSFADSKAIETKFTPTSDAVSLSYDTKPGEIYTLTDVYTPYNCYSNGSLIGKTGYGVRLTYKANDAGLYVLVTKAKRSRSIHDFTTSATYSSLSSSTTNPHEVDRMVYSLAAGESRYFLLNQSNTTYYGDTISVKMAKALKVNADTVGDGKAYVGENTRNYDSSYVANDTVPLKAVSGAKSKFQKWEKVSGTCTILNPSAAQASVIISSDCKVRATFVPATMYQITTAEKKYNPRDNYYSGSPTDGVRFYFVAPSDGLYAIKYKKDSTEWSYLSRYKTSAFTNPEINRSTKTSIADTVSVMAGDTVFYLVKIDYVSDTLMSFSMSYEKLSSVSVSVESTSPECSTGTYSTQVLKGTVVYIEALSREGFRPDGWTVVSGSRKFKDSTTFYIRDTIETDTKIKLKCRASKLIDLTDKFVYYNPYDDFYEKSPSVGMKFRYVAPTSGLYAFRFIPSGLTGTYRFYGLDSTFKTTKKYFSNTTSKNTFFAGATSGDKFFFTVVPYSNSYWDDSVAVAALPAGTFKIQDQSRVDTLALGDTIAVNAVLDSGEHFVKWTIVSGKGRFIDSTLMSTSYIFEKTSVVKPVTSRLPLYELTEQYKGFTYKNNGSYNNASTKTYGVRTVLDPAVNGTYIIQYKGVNTVYMNSFGSDSTFRSYSRYTCYTGSSVCKITMTLNAHNKRYFQLEPYSNLYLTDSVWVRAMKTRKIQTDTSGTGYAYVTSSGTRNVDSTTYTVGDTVIIRAATGSAKHKFNKWSVASGSCKILDPTKSYTYVVLGGDCKVKAEFILGTVYPITEIATKYNPAEHYYSISATKGVRFNFVAPASGTYTFAFRGLDAALSIDRYPTGGYDADGSYTTRSNAVYEKFDQLTLSAGDSVFYIVRTNSYADSTKSFWVNYSQSKVAITLTSDGNGNVTPTSGYPNAWSGAAYQITAAAQSGYRFDKWVFVSGKGGIDDSLNLRTVAYATENSTIKALFKRGSVYELTTKKETYTFQKHHYSDSALGSVRYSWTAKDTNYYYLVIDSVKGTCVQYGEDSTFKTILSKTVLNGKSSVLVQGEPGKTLYFTVVDSLLKPTQPYNWTVQLVTPNRLNIESKKGLAVPSGDVYVLPGADTVVYAVPYGGYVFDSWTKVLGTVNISDPKNSTTRVKPESDNSVIRANYVLDSATIPSLKITNLDLSNHPGICAHVSVVDERTGMPIVGLDSTNFVLFQDKTALPAQTTTIQSLGGVSVALVVDESGSMRGNRIIKAKEALRRFIYEMGPYDRTAIVGFMGYDSVKVHQPMTSNKTLLLQAVELLNASGDTNIRTGTKLGIQQVIGETNPTAVIVFSDGENGTDRVTLNEVVDLARSANTTIYSIGLETTSTNPLKNMADSTGGSYTYAPNASQLTSIYTTIRGTVQERYVLCYQSPDGVWDGDTHTVVVEANFIDKDAKDTAYWNEDFLPPKVDLTESTWKLVDVEQKENDSLVISVYVTSKDSIKSVTLHMRKTGLKNESFAPYSMKHVKDSLWTYTIPDSLVNYPGIDFYVVALDSHGLAGRTPAVPNPSKQPYTIPVKNKVPVVSMDALKCVDMKSGYGKLRFTISDKNGIYGATLYYRDSLSVLFDEIQMTRNSGYWEASIPSTSFISGMGEIYVRAIDSVGAGVRWPQKETVYIPVCNRQVYIPDVKDEITIVNTDSANAPIGRTTKTVGITVKTEDFSDDVDTIVVKLSCLISGDEENKIVLVEKEDGFFVNRDTLYKNEHTPKNDDGKISCEAYDTMIAEYKDPLYGTVVQDEVDISDSVSFSYRFLEPKKDKDLDSVETVSDANFRISVTALSESIHNIDTLKLLLFTSGKDSLWVKAIETGAYTSTFEYTGAFHFVENESDLKASELDGVFDLKTSHNRVKIQASIKGDKSSLSKRDSLIVYSNYVPADYAVLYDTDLDGKADSVRIKFITPLNDSLEGIDTLYWNKAGGTWRSVSKKNLRAVEKRLWFEARLKEPFEYGATAPDAENVPYLRLKDSQGGFPQKVKIKDKIGAVPVEAVKHAGVVPLDKFLENSDEIPPDTLVVTMSEKVKNKGKSDAWKNLFVYTSSCEDSTAKEKSLSIDKILEKDSTGVVWKFVLKTHILKTEDCIRANPKATYVDYEGNSMGRGGVKVTGSNGDQYLYEVAPVTAVSGVGQEGEWIAPGDDEWSDLPDSLMSVRVASIMPYTAHVIIYDALSHVVTSFKQEFGEKGEMTQKVRGNSDNHAKTGFLFWDKRSKQGRLVGTGVYIWRIDFKFKDGHSEFRLVKTGLRRKK